MGPEKLTGDWNVPYYNPCHPESFPTLSRIYSLLLSRGLFPLQGEKKIQVVNFKPMVICEAADQKMYWLITLVLAAKLVIDGTCYFSVLGIFITL